MNKPIHANDRDVSSEPSTDRRSFLSSLGKLAIAGAATAGTIGVKPFIDGQASEAAGQKLGTNYSRRALKCYQLRHEAAKENLDGFPNRYHSNNGDEYLYPNKIASFSKGLPHNSNGEVDVSEFNKMTDALRGAVDFEQVGLGGDWRFVNPQSGLAFDVQGGDPQSFYIPPAPAFSSREIAAEIAENYWMALLRDVPFDEYQNNPVAAAAAEDLSLFGNDFKGAKNAGGKVTSNLLFRGLSAADKIGPQISQFFYQPCFFGANKLSQKIRTARSLADGGRDYMTDFNSWLEVQNGVSQTEDLLDPAPRYIRNGRDIGQWVHVDVLFQAYFQAFLILTETLSVPFDENNPYNRSRTQDGFGTFGAPHIASLLCEVATRALKAVWFQKWYIHRRLRPEAFAARVHQRLYVNAGYPVHGEILDSISTASRLGGYLQSGNALLPLAFPEGSPVHPSYGAGHATVAGACSTILKAFFDESAIIENPLVPNASGTAVVPYNGSEVLTVGGELNKIASNVALARNIAGVHWRSDGTESLKLGEALAVSILRDQRNCYNEQFSGFTLTKFDGTVVTV